jgi:hypothetical protein
MGDSPEERQAKRPAPVAGKRKQKKTAPVDTARESRPSRVAGERAKDAKVEAAIDDEGPSPKVRGKRKVVESENEEWLEEVQLGMRIADCLGGVDPYKRFENLEREVIRQGELLSSICEYLGISETGIPRLPL